MGREERDFLLERVPMAPRLARRLRTAYHDVAQVQPAVRPAPEERRRGGALYSRRQRLAEREHVGRAVDATVAAVQLAHRAVVDERERDGGVARQTERPERRADRGARGREVTRRGTGDG